MNNDDERDYEEEAANRRLMEEGDDDGPVLPLFCEWYAMCLGKPVVLIAHPILGPVAACERCKKLAEHASPPADAA